MPLMGQHSQNSGGTQGLMAALQALANKGDPASLATIQKIAAGGKTTGAEVPGWNETIDWSTDTGHGNTGGRAADRAEAAALLSGNTGQVSSIEANKAATHKDWTGGDLAKYAPAALALIPGIGVPLAAGAGAAMGALESKAGLTNTSLLGGAAGGAAVAGGATAAKAALTKALAPGGNALSTSNLTKGAALLAGGGAAGAAGASPSAAGLLNSGLGIASTVQGASDMAAAARNRQAAVDAAQGDYSSLAPVRQAAVAGLLAPRATAPDLTSVYSNPQNPFAVARRKVAPLSTASLVRG